MFPLPTDATPDAIAAATIRDACGWHIAPPMVEAVTLDGNGTRRMALPTLHVVAISAVSVDGVLLDPSGYRWSADGWLTRYGGVWPDLERSVEVVMEHGFDDAPALEAVAKAVAARVALGSTGIIADQAVGPFRRTYAVSGGEVRSVGLLQSERAVLAPYMLGTVPRV